MPRSISTRLPKDLLYSLDADIFEVTYEGQCLSLKIDSYYDTYCTLNVTEQDLVTLLEFLRKNKNAS